MEYQHGGDIYTNSVDMDYSANLNPLGLPDGVREVLHSAINTSSCYPDSRCTALRLGLSRLHGVPARSIICGNGAAELIFLMVRSMKPKRALLLSPSFLEYEQALKAEGSDIIYFDLAEGDGFRLFPDRLIAYLEDITPKPDMIFICNPNNPTGLAVKNEEMIKILDYCQRNKIFCVIDECFHEFLETPEEYTVLEYIKANKSSHVFLLKAFTKIYAMAGIRLGYGICSQEALLERANLCRQPWSVSSLAQAAGEAALKEQEYVNRTRRLIWRERRFLSEGLKALGFAVWPSMANYIFFRDNRPEAKPHTHLLYDQCLKRRVLIRSCANYQNLDGTYYRICVKDRKENEALLSVLKSIEAH